MAPRRRRVFARVLTVLACALLAACTHRAPAPMRDFSGFLDDYSRLRVGDQGDLPFVYRNAEAHWTSYDKVLIEPVALWRSGKNALAPIPEEELLRLVTHVERAVRTRLGAGFTIVTDPSPGTLRLRLAVTEARSNDPIVDVLTAAPNDPKLAGGSGPLGAPLAAFVDAASIEGELRDAVNEDLLAQGIDRRRVGAPPRLQTWEQLDRALAFWADRVCSRLEARTGRR
jgi:hypothetical protein